MRSSKQSGARAARRLAGIVLVAGVLLSPASEGWGEGTAPETVFRLEETGFSTPESVLHDREADVYLVSNINGAPDGRDGNGFISRLSPDGTVLALKWIEGGKGKTELDAPKGMAIAGDELFVADISSVRVFDRKTGTFKASISIPNAAFLNDVCEGEDGSIYVTDTMNPAVYHLLPDRSVRAIAAGKELGNPNGIVAVRGDVLVADYGAKRIYSIDKGGKPIRERAVPAGGLDGLIRLPDGSLLVSSWEASSVYRIAPDGSAKVVVDGIQSPADIEFDVTRGALLIPVFQKNEVLSVRHAAP